MTTIKLRQTEISLLCTDMKIQLTNAKDEEICIYFW